MSDEDKDRRDELLAIAATILVNQQGVMSGMVRLAGTQVEIKITPAVKSYTTAAVMLARHLIETVDAITTECDQ